MRLWPQAQHILFLDGDCTLEPSFVSVAATELTTNDQCAIVTGHLSEQYPDRSIYNRLCSIEWRSPPGQFDGLNALGGIMMARVSAFRAVGGFNERAIAGEEADLGVRLRLAGYSFTKVDAPMATHDARILTFRQWWIRAVRGGYAFAHRYAEHGSTSFHDGRREVFSALFWGLALPSIVLLLLIPSRGLSVLLLGGYALLGLRIYRYYRRRGLSRSDALLSARFGICTKFAHVVGILRFASMGKQGSAIIEYK
jgi:GT2 family glycosyltransferase